MKNLLVSLMLVMTLTACGGGGTKSSGSSRINISNGLIVPDFDTSREGTPRSNFINSRGEYVVGRFFRDIYIDNVLYGKTGLGKAYQSESDYNNGGTWHGIRLYEDSESETNILFESYRDEFYVTIEDQYIPKLNNIPTGVHKYKGFNAAAAYNSSGDWFGIGSFVMNVNFSSGEGYIKGGTDWYEAEGEFDQTWSSEIEGYIRINSNTGIFFADSLNLRVDYIHSYATINGNFHGINASGVTGIYEGTGDNDDVKGGIAGRNCSIYRC